MVATPSRIRRLAIRIRRIFAELHYAQRRLFEPRTGVGALPTARHTARRQSVEDLEALYELDYPVETDRV